MFGVRGHATEAAMASKNYKNKPCAHRDIPARAELEARWRSGTRLHD